MNRPKYTKIIEENGEIWLVLIRPYKKLEKMPDTITAKRVQKITEKGIDTVLPHMLKAKD